MQLPGNITFSPRFRAGPVNPQPTTSPPPSSDALISQVALQLENCKCGAQSYK